MNIDDTTIERCMMKLLAERSAESSICPSDVARTLVSDETAWRALMPVVRQVAARLRQIAAELENLPAPAAAQWSRVAAALVAAGASPRIRKTAWRQQPP